MADKTIRPFRAQTTNAQIMDAIRNTASSDYQRRVPPATKADVKASQQAMLNNTPARNEFIDAFMNRIGLTIARNESWTNPLAKFKIGQLNFGDTIEEYALGLAEAYVYETDREYLERDLFGQERTESQSSFHKINRENFYKITVKEVELRRAFDDEFGLSKLITQLMAVPVKSDNWDEFLLTANLFREYNDSEGFFAVNVPDISVSGSTEADAKYALRRIRELSDTLPFLSRHYNAAGLPVSANREDLELFITPEANAALDVEALAGAFNIEKSAVPSRMTVIPREHVNIPGFQAVLTTKDFFVIADSYYGMNSQPNAAGLHTNYFLHHHQVISASRFVPAVLFTTGAGTVINLAATPVTGVSAITVTNSEGATVPDVKRGELYNVEVSAITDGDNDATVLTLSGAKSPLTYLTQAGTLHVSPDEAATALDITATSTDNDAFAVSITVDVVGDILKLWPDAKVTTGPTNAQEPHPEP